MINVPYCLYLKCHIFVRICQRMSAAEGKEYLLSKYMMAPRGYLSPPHMKQLSIIMDTKQFFSSIIILICCLLPNLLKKCKAYFSLMLYVQFVIIWFRRSKHSMKKTLKLVLVSSLSQQIKKPLYCSPKGYMKLI